MGTICLRLHLTFDIHAGQRGPEQPSQSLPAGGPDTQLTCPGHLPISTFHSGLVWAQAAHGPKEDVVGHTRMCTHTYTHSRNTQAITHTHTPRTRTCTNTQKRLMFWQSGGHRIHFLRRLVHTHVHIQPHQPQQSYCPSEIRPVVPHPCLLLTLGPASGQRLGGSGLCPCSQE